MVTLDTSSSIAATAPHPAPSDISICPFTILVDQQEQHPWTFQGIVSSKSQLIIKRRVVHLKTGDYTIDWLESNYTIERKSPEDLVGSVAAGHERFEREHQRMLAMVEAGGQACVIVEGSLAAICDELDADGRWKVRKTLLGCVTSWPFKYRVPWLFAGSRRMAEEVAFGVLQKWWERKDDRRQAELF